jgi:hypothetical protein
MITAAGYTAWPVGQLIERGDAPPVRFNHLEHWQKA